MGAIDNEEDARKKPPQVHTTNPRAYNLPTYPPPKKAVSPPPHVVPVGGVVGPWAPEIRPGETLDYAKAMHARQYRLKVQTTPSYKQRVKHHGRNPYEGRFGVIMQIHNFGQGYVCDVIWDNGKLLQGYCVGYGGMFDLQMSLGHPASTSTYNGSANVSDISEDQTNYSKRAETPVSDSGSQADVDIKVMVGYLGTAPKVEYTGPKHIWSCTGGVFADKEAALPSLPEVEKKQQILVDM